MCKCFVIGCRNNITTRIISTLDISFPKFPSKQAKWLKACSKVPDLNVKNGMFIILFG